MRFVLTVTVSVLLSSILTPVVGPWAREKVQAGATSVANFISDHLEVKVKKTKVGSHEISQN